MHVASTDGLRSGVDLHLSGVRDNAQIRQLRLAVAIEQNISRFDVPVHYLQFVVEEGKRAQHIVPYLCQDRRRHAVAAVEGAPAAHRVQERAAVHELHHKVERVVRVEHIVARDNAHVIHAVHGDELAQRTALPLVFRVISPYHDLLQRQRLASRHVLALPHYRCVALAHFLQLADVAKFDIHFASLLAPARLWCILGLHRLAVRPPYIVANQPRRQKPNPPRPKASAQHITPFRECICELWQRQ
mmetsp:Transcript_30721/g.44914  ORF Transcript_30721/g.44914 Transcript_30721/m.44914 type:complete len:245 (-) Transcript_30721:854-1588(-)